MYKNVEVYKKNHQKRLKRDKNKTTKR